MRKDNRRRVMRCAALFSCALYLCFLPPRLRRNRGRLPEPMGGIRNSRGSWAATLLPAQPLTNWKCGSPTRFDLPTIDRELGWAQSLGMNTMRVFLHNLLWTQDPQGFLHRMDRISGGGRQAPHTDSVRAVGFRVGSRIRASGSSERRSLTFITPVGCRLAGAELLKDKSRWDAELKPYIVGVLRRFRR
jgi:hypothetical protein